MRTIVIDDEQVMLKNFLHYSDKIEDLDVVRMFSNPEEALEYAEKEKVDLAVLDITMPQMSGIELSKKLRDIRPDIMIVFVTAHTDFIREANEMGADDYIVKPYTYDTIKQMADKMNLISKRQEKRLYIQTFGRFLVLKNGMPIKLNGKAKEILALIVTRRGKEISNEEIYMTIWENREYSNSKMKVYYNALARLKKALESQGISGLLISTPHGQMLNTENLDCDFFNWQDGRPENKDRFEGEFMSEYSWGEPILGSMVSNTVI